RRRKSERGGWGTLPVADCGFFGGSCLACEGTGKAEWRRRRARLTLFDAFPGLCAAGDAARAFDVELPAAICEFDAGVGGAAGCRPQNCAAAPAAALRRQVPENDHADKRLVLSFAFAFRAIR